MAIETEQKTIDGITYRVMQMDAIRGLKVQTKLIKLLGPALGKTLLSGGEMKVAALKDKVAGHLIENFDDEEVSKFVIGLFDKGVFFVKGDEEYLVDFKKDFTGKPFAVWKVVWFILETNFGDLLGKLMKGSSHLLKTVLKSPKEG